MQEQVHPRARSGHDQLARHGVRSRGKRGLSRRKRSFAQIYPQPGWVEHDPQEIWSTQAGVAAEAVTRAGPERGGDRRRSASPTSARRPSCGTAQRVSRCTTRSSGRTAAPPTFCDELRGAGPRRHRFVQRPACRSMHTSRRRRSAGSSTTWTARARKPGRARLAFGTVDSVARHGT